MFFRRKKSKNAEDLRRFYRRVPAKAHTLGVKLRLSGKPPITGELLDLSAGGAGVSLPRGKDPGLAVDATGVLVITSLTNPAEVTGEARVTSVSAVDGGTRYGFEFIDPGKLFAQLDSFYVRFFNRRRCLRARPALGTKIAVQLVPESGAIEATLHDVSSDGCGVLLDAERARGLDGVQELEVAFVVPKSGVELRWATHPVHLTVVPRGVQFGGTFRPAKSSDLKRQRAALAAYTASRESEMARWDAAAD